jgi:hypothetical protein
MERLKHLEKEVLDLRMEKRCGAPDVQKLFADSGWKFTQNAYGGWDYTIPMKGCQVFSGNHRTLEDAIRNALRRSEEFVVEEAE